MENEEKLIGSRIKSLRKENKKSWPVNLVFQEAIFQR